MMPEGLVKISSSLMVAPLVWNLLAHTRHSHAVRNLTTRAVTFAVRPSCPWSSSRVESQIKVRDFSKMQALPSF